MDRASRERRWTGASEAEPTRAATNGPSEPGGPETGMRHPRRRRKPGRTRRAPECAAAGRPRRIGRGQQTAGPAEGAGRLGLVPATESLPPTEEPLESAAHLGSGALPVHHGRPALTAGGPGRVGRASGRRIGGRRRPVSAPSEPRSEKKVVRGSPGPSVKRSFRAAPDAFDWTAIGVGQHGEAPVDGPPVGTRCRPDLGHGSHGQDHDDRHHDQGSDQPGHPPSHAASPSEPASFPDHRAGPYRSEPAGREPATGSRDTRIRAARRHYTRLPCPSAPPLHLPRSTGASTSAAKDGSAWSRQLVRVGALVVAIVVVVAGAAFGYADYRNHQIHHVRWSTA